RLVGGSLDHRHGLEKAAVVATRLQPDALVLGLDVGDGLLLAGRAGGAALELVRRQGGHHHPQVVGVDVGLEGVVRGGSGGGSGGGPGGGRGGVGVGRGGLAARGQQQAAGAQEDQGRTDRKSVV